MTGTAIHRNNDSRACGASTIVSGQRKVFVNGELASVIGDPNSHGGGRLSASNNDGTVYINNALVVLLGSSASADKLCPPLGPPHCNPSATSASPDVYACGGGKVEPIGSDTSYEVSSNGGSSSGNRSGGRNTSQRDNGAPNTDNIPQNTGGATKVPPDYTSISALESDPAWKRKLDEMQTKYPGLTREEVYSIIQGESRFDKKAKASNSSATGLFQFTEGALKTLNNRYGTSYTTGKIQNMSPVEQLEVYDKYLESYDYNSNMGLGIIQAAPAFRNRPPSFEVYAVGSDKWIANPPWRGPDGKITVQSINDYYDRFRK